jgi:hypothetical protein
MVPGTAWEGQGVIGLTSEYDDGAFTPVLLVNYDVPLSVEYKVSYRAEYIGPDGEAVSFDPSPTFRVKAWGF